MDIERRGDFTLYKFSQFEHLLVNAALKHVDRKRRQGSSDSLPIHSAMRAIASEEINPDEGDRIVHWIIDDREAIGAENDFTILDPTPKDLSEVMQYAADDINSGDRVACAQPIGKIAFARYGYVTDAENYREPLSVFGEEIQLFSRILEAHSS